MIHRVKHQAFFIRPDQHELFFAAAYELGNSDTTALGHGIGEQEKSKGKSLSTQRQSLSAVK
jgi:hypothetical protein